MTRNVGTMKKFAFLAATLLVFSAALMADDDDRRCPAPAEECAMKIRETMTGQKFLGVIFYDSETGIYVKSVVSGSPAEEAGLKGGDFIVGIEGQDISDGNVKLFKKLFGKAQKKGTLTLKVRRGDETLTTTAHLREITEEQITRIIAAHMDAAHSDNKVTSSGKPKQP